MLALMVVLVFGNVVLRYGFNSGIAVSEEVSRYLFIWLTFIGAVIAVHEHAHLGVDTLAQRAAEERQAVLRRRERSADARGGRHPLPRQLDADGDQHGDPFSGLRGAAGADLHRRPGRQRADGRAHRAQPVQGAVRRRGGQGSRTQRGIRGSGRPRSTPRNGFWATRTAAPAWTPESRKPGARA